VKPELIVLVLALLLVVAAFNVSSLSDSTRLVLILLALVSSILAWLHQQGAM
jgi:1,4-dihydroxy-2-naphthoate octaprenyltransferase